MFEWLYPHKYSELQLATCNFAFLHSTTKSHFWGNIGDGNMGTLKKLGENIS